MRITTLCLISERRSNRKISIKLSVVCLKFVQVSWKNRDRKKETDRQRQMMLEREKVLKWARQKGRESILFFKQTLTLGINWILCNGGASSMRKRQKQACEEWGKKGQLKRTFLEGEKWSNQKDSQYLNYKYDVHNESYNYIKIFQYIFTFIEVLGRG